MSRVHVFIATTDGPVRVESVVAYPPSKTDPPVTSMALVEGLGAASFSSRYREFVQTVIYPRFRHAGYFNASVARDIPAGDSWRLGLFLAHCVQADEALELANNGISAGDKVLFATGDVTNKYQITSVDHIAEKFQSAQTELDCWLDTGASVTAIVPRKNGDDVPREFRTYCRGKHSLALTKADDAKGLLSKPQLSSPKRRRARFVIAAAVVAFIVGGALLTGGFPHRSELHREVATWLGNLPVVAENQPERTPLPNLTAPSDSLSGADGRPSALPLPTSVEGETRSDSPIREAAPQQPEPVRPQEPSSALLDELATPTAEPPLETESSLPTELIEPGSEPSAPPSPEGDIGPSLLSTATGDVGTALDEKRSTRASEPSDPAPAPKIVIVPVKPILSLSIEPTFDIKLTAENERVPDSQEEARESLQDYLENVVGRAVRDSRWLIRIRSNPDNAQSITSGATPISDTERRGLQDSQLLIEQVVKRKEFDTGDRIHVELTARLYVGDVQSNFDAVAFKRLGNDCVTQECVNSVAVTTGRDAADELANDIRVKFRELESDCCMYRLHLANLGREKRRGIESALATLPGRIRQTQISDADSHSEWEYLSSRRASDLSRQLSEIVSYEGLPPMSIQVQSMTFRVE